MPSTPTTKSQVQAYRFVLRRMQSALVRRDSVMLHDPMRSHGRATIVGVLLGMLGLLGFVVFGLISPSPGLPNAPGIVVGKDSGQIYVLSGNPPTLTPTFNLASARLLLMSQQQGGGTGVVQPTVVPDDSLKDVPRGRRTGILDGPTLLPTGDQRISDNWAVCDNLNIDAQLPASIQLNSAQRTTTVYAGVSNLGQELAPNQAVLAVADDNRYYLIYRLPPDPNNPAANQTVRAKVDPNDTGIQAAFNLNGPTPRKISTGLLNAIPSAPALTEPDVPNLGRATSFPALQALGMTNGSVFQVNSATGQDTFVVLPNGIQRISPPVAQLLLAESGGDPTVHQANLTALSQIPQLQPNSPGALQVGTIPATVPTVLDPVQFPTNCLGWSLVNGQPHTSLFVDRTPPTPSNGKLTAIGKAGPGGKIDSFFMPTGRGAVIQSANTGADSLNKGPISLVTDSGLRYGIPNLQTAQGLGLGDPPPRPAPSSIVDLLPTGTTLDTNSAQRSFNDIEVLPGTSDFPSQAPNQNQAAGAGAPGN